MIPARRAVWATAAHRARSRRARAPRLEPAARLRFIADWETVREIALGFPEVEEATEGRPAFRVRGKLFAWTARERDGGGLAVRVDRDEKQLLLDAHPEVYFTSPHYNGYPGIQIRLELIEREELAERLEDAWLIQAPRQLAKTFLADNP